MTATPERPDAYPPPWKGDHNRGCKRIRAYDHDRLAFRQTYYQIAYTAGLMDDAEDAANADAILLIPHVLAGQRPGWATDSRLELIANLMTPGPWTVRPMTLEFAVGPEGQAAVAYTSSREVADLLATAPEAVSAPAVTGPLALTEEDTDA